MKRLLEADSSSNGTRNVVGRLAAGPEQHQGDGQQPNVVQGHGQQNAQLLQVLVTPASQPVQGQAGGAPLLLGLPAEVGMRILGRLNGNELLRAMQTCRRMHEWGAQVRAVRAGDPHSMFAWHCLEYCASEMESMNIPYHELGRISIERGTQIAQNYAPGLLKLASNVPCIEVHVWPGNENVVFEALRTGQAWRAAHIRIHSEDCDPQFFAKLEMSLSQQNRVCELKLSVEHMCEPQRFFPQGLALKLVALSMYDVGVDSMQKLLGGQNDLRYIYLASEVAEDVLPALPHCCHDLIQLGLDDMPADTQGRQLLLRALGKKQNLISLHLGNGAFHAELNLAAVFKAAPQLQALALSSVDFCDGSASDCEQALVGSSLKALWLSEIVFTDKQGKAAFLNGIAKAPCLVRLECGWGGFAAYKTFMGAFARNPAAQTLYCKQSSPELTAWLEGANRTRQQEGMPAIRLSGQSSRWLFPH